MFTAFIFNSSYSDNKLWYRKSKEEFKNRPLWASRRHRPKRKLLCSCHRYAKYYFHIYITYHSWYPLEMSCQYVHTFCLLSIMQIRIMITTLYLEDSRVLYHNYRLRYPAVISLSIWLSSCPSVSLSVSLHAKSSIKVYHSAMTSYQIVLVIFVDESESFDSEVSESEAESSKSSHDTEDKECQVRPSVTLIIWIDIQFYQSQAMHKSYWVICAFSLCYK